MAFARSVTWELPDWIFQELDLEAARQTPEERMRFAIEVAQRNVNHGGGPFGAAVFERTSGRVTSVGANLVVSQGCSLLHAEVVALAFAQAKLGQFTLSAGSYELVTSSEPCVQCLGALYWSGIERLVCGAPVVDAEAVGFDEGPRSANWSEELASRGIQVDLLVLAAEAREVLLDYQRRGGVVYNAR